MAEPSIGERVAALRRRRGLTQEQLAQRAGVSVSTLRKLEQNDRTSASLPTLRRLAGALAVTTVDLFVPAPQFAPRADESDRDDLFGIRRVLQPARTWDGAAVVSLADDEAAPTLAGLAESVGEINSLFRDSEYGAAIAALPTAIAYGQNAVAALDGDEKLAAHRQLSQAYQTAGMVLTQTRTYDLAYYALGLALSAAQLAQDEVLAASVVCGENWLLTRQGRFDEAERAALLTAEAIEPSLAKSSAAHFGVWGWLNLGAAASAVRNSRTDVATDAIRRARAAAELASPHTPDGSVAHWTRFDPLVVAMRETELAVVADDIDTAFTAASRVRGNPEPKITYQRFRLDVASALTTRRRYDEAFTVLSGLRASAPGWLRHQRYARSITGRLVSARARTVPADLRELADFLAVPH